MLNKPLSHLRPLLRIPTHHTPQPDHFSANPSLLHHLGGSNNAHGHAIAQAGGNAASSGSGAGSSGAGAGRAGWAGSGPGQGGYTGHARAFLSLSQTGAVDASSSLSQNDDQRQQTASSRQSALLKNRMGRTVRVVDMEEAPVAGPSSHVNRRIGNGSRSKLKAVDLGFEDGREFLQPELLELQDGSSARRSSIAFPSIPASSPPSRSSRPPAINRSTSSSDLWQVGIPTRPAYISIRPLSTRTSNVDLRQVEDVVAEDITAVRPISSQRIPQPNHVLQDLAGLDLPRRGRSARQLRYNSTAAARREIVDDIEIPTPPERSQGLRQSKQDAEAVALDEKKNREIYRSLDGAIHHQQKKQAREIIEHYRRPRNTSPFGPGMNESQRRMEERYPLPSYYRIEMYNLCLEAVIALRSAGESIAPVLEMYNEMIERDVVPNLRTYALVIRALGLREGDIARATKDWQAADELRKWRAQHFGTQPNLEISASRQASLEGYRHEKNFSSALKLLQAALLLNNQEWRPFTGTYDDVLTAAVASAESGSDKAVDLHALMNVFRHGLSREVSGMRGLYRHMFKVQSIKGDSVGLQNLWREFANTMADDARSNGANPSEWVGREVPVRGSGAPAQSGDLADDSDLKRERMLELMDETWAAAIESFVAVDDVTTAEKVLQAMLDSPNHAAEIAWLIQDLRKPPQARPEHFARFVLALQEAGKADLASEWWSKMTADPVLAQMCASGVYDLPASLAARLVHRFVIDGQANLAFEALTCSLWSARLRAQLSADTVTEAYLGLVQLGLAKLAEGQTEEALDIATNKLQAVQSLLNGDLRPDLAAMVGSVKLLLNLDRADLLRDVLSRFRRTKADLSALRAAIIPAFDRVDLQTCLSVATQVKRLEGFVGSDIAERMLRKFDEARGTTETGANVLTSKQQCYALLECGAFLDAQDVQSGTFDDVLMRLLEDASALMGPRDQNRQPLPSWAAQLTQNLEHRFGPDRTKTWLEALFPGQVDALLTAETEASPAPAAASGAADTSSLPDLDSASATSHESAAVQPSTPPTQNRQQFQQQQQERQQQERAPRSRAPQAGRSGPEIDMGLSQEVDKFSSAWRNMNKAEVGFRSWRWGLQNGKAVHPAALGRLISALGREGHEGPMREVYDNAQVVLRLLSEEEQPDAWRAVEDNMIMGFCSLGHLEAAGMHRSRLIEAGMSPSADAYGTMIASSKDTTDDSMVALALYEEAIGHGVKPNLYLYNTVISKLSKARKAEAALALFAQLKADGINPTSVTYGALINGCCRVGDAESAETLFNEMVAMPNFKPRVPPYNTMMQFYLSTKPDRERVLYYYQMLLQSGIRPSAHTYKLLLDAYSTIDPVDIPSMEKVFQSLQADPAVQVQGTHYASVVTAFGKHDNNVEGAIAFFNNISARQLEPVVWEALLNVLATNGTLEQLEEYHARLFSSPIAPTAYVYNAIITGYARLGQLERARDIFESMGDSIMGVAAPNNHPALLTNSGHQKPATTTNTPTGVVYREPSTYTRMIVAELETPGGSRERAEDVLRRMEARAYPFAVYVKARNMLYGQEGPAEPAMEVAQPAAIVPADAEGEKKVEEQALEKTIT